MNLSCREKDLEHASIGNKYWGTHLLGKWNNAKCNNGVSSIQWENGIMVSHPFNSMRTIRDRDVM